MSCVNVVIPCYKYAHFLRGCVQSVLGQEGVDLRVLIIDDASPDSTAAVAAELAEADARVEFRQHRTNQGHIATYNEGLLDWAADDYALLLSADDLLTPGALARAARVLDARTEVGLVYGRQVHFECEEQLPSPRPVPSDMGHEIVAGSDYLERCCASTANPVATPTAVVRTRLLKQLGGYRPELPHTADMELWMRFAVHGAVGVIEADQAYKRMHGHNMQCEYVAAALADIEQHHAAFAILFRDWGHRIAERDRLQQLATATLAQKAFWAASHAFDGGDTDRCRLLLQFAEGIDTAVRSRVPWSRLQWKQRFGVTPWSWLRPWADRLRGRAQVSA